MAADPTIAFQVGTADLNFDEDTGWTLDKAQIGTVLEDTGMVLVPQEYSKYDPLDSDDFSKWFTVDNLVFDTSSGNYIGSGAAVTTGSAGGDVNFIRAAFGAGVTNRISVVTFKSPPFGGAGWNKFWFQIDSKQAEPLPLDAFLNFGWDPDDPTYPDNFVFKIGDGPIQNGGPYRETGEGDGVKWHKLVMATGDSTSIEGRTTEHMIVFDGTEIYYDSNINPPDSNLSTQWRAWIMAFQGGVQDNIYIDNLILTKGAGTEEVYDQGSAISPLIQPKAVASWSNFSVTEDTTGMWLGTTAYQAQYTTDGGTNYGTNSPGYDDGTFETLSAANLAAVTVDQDGQDGLRVKVIHTPDATLPNMNNSRKAWIPRTTNVQIVFLPGDPWSETAGASDSFSETAAPTGGFSETSAPTGGFSETSPPAGGFAEVSAPTGGFAETEAPAGSWTETSGAADSFAETSAPSGTWTETEGSADSFSETSGGSDSFSETSAPSGTWTETVQT